MNKYEIAIVIANVLLLVSVQANANSVDIQTFLFPSVNNTNFDVDANHNADLIDISGIVDDGITQKHIESIIFNEDGLALEFDIVEGG